MVPRFFSSWRLRKPGRSIIKMKPPANHEEDTGGPRNAFVFVPSPLAVDAQVCPTVDGGIVGDEVKRPPTVCDAIPGAVTVVSPIRQLGCIAHVP